MHYPIISFVLEATVKLRELFYVGKCLELMKWATDVVVEKIVDSQKINGEGHSNHRNNMYNELGCT